MESNLVHTPPSLRSLARLYVRLLAHRKRPFLIALAVLLGLNFYTLVPPLAVGAVVDLLVAGTSGQDVFWLAVYSGAFGLSFALVSLARLTLKRYLSALRNDIGYHIRTSAFEKLLGRAMSGGHHLTGADTQKVLTGVTDFYDFTRLLQNEIFAFIAGLSGAVVIFLFVDKTLVVFFAVYLALFAILIRRFTARLQALNMEAVKAREHTTGTLVDTLSNSLTVVGLKATDAFTGRMSNAAMRVKEIEDQLLSTSILQWKLFQCGNGLTLGFFLGFVGWQAIHGRMSPGLVLTCFGYMQSLIGVCSTLLEFWEILQRHIAGLYRLGAILGLDDPRTAGAQPLSHWREVSFAGVSHQYQGQIRKSLDDVNVVIKRGSRVGLTGRSGSGKSTFAKILAGILIPTDGKILVDGMELSHGHIRTAMALQECELFSLSLRDNITMLKDVLPSFLSAVISVAQLEPVINRLPEGLDTLVGEKGYSLSGGERQRVSLARALALRPDILVLDEATSQLDSKTEELFFEGLLTLLPEVTLVVITHHERGLQAVSEQLHFESGRVIALALDSAVA